MNDLVSIVVPIYNVEKYLDRCLQSILSQTYKNIEVILVDDGSPDGCPRICDAYAKKDSRVKVIHKENAGAGMARNTGIKHATGKYICFFDSDDYIEPDTIECCVVTANESCADLVVFGYDSVTDVGRWVSTNVPCPSQWFFSGDEINQLLLPNAIQSGQNIGVDWKIPLSPCNKFYSLKVIRENEWFFASERVVFSEDFYSLTELHSYLKRIVIIDRVLYHRVENPTSITRTFNPERFSHIKDFYQSMCLLSESMGLRMVLDQSIKAATLGFFIWAMKQIVNADLAFLKRYYVLREMIWDSTLQLIVWKIDFSSYRFQKKLLCRAIKFKYVWVCFLLLYLKSRK